MLPEHNEYIVLYELISISGPNICTSIPSTVDVGEIKSKENENVSSTITTFENFFVKDEKKKSRIQRKACNYHVNGMQIEKMEAFSSSYSALSKISNYQIVSLNNNCHEPI